MKTMRVFFRTTLSALACCLAVGAQAKQIELNAALATPVVKAGKAQSAFLKVSLTGFALPAQGQRSAANVAIVIDRSGSMQGDRIAQARRAAVMAIDSLTDDDIVSVLAFDDTVEVVVPATKAVEKTAIKRAIERIQSRGSTALFAGVSKGAGEVRKFLDKARVNRVILLSDGQANVGPSSPAELGQLGSTLAREGISVTTIGLGLGYNEDLMTQLAGYSDGNHAFVAKAEDLARIFRNEFGDVSSVVAQELEVIIRLSNGIRPVRILGREGEIMEGSVRLRMNQLYSEQEKFVILEVEVPPGKAGDKLNLASVDVSYLNMQSKHKEQLSRAVAVGFTDSAEKIAKAVDKKVMTSAVEQVSNIKNKEALKLRDEGKTEEAKKVLTENAEYLKDNASSLNAPALNALEQEQRSQASSIGSGDWNAQRKGMKEKQYKLEKQQRY
ncbi:MAG: VWA domain-containing protein [Burkholderiales bacterium]|nr:VWA domain-containing protein [Burkholderiales bacterium]